MKVDTFESLYCKVRILKCVVEKWIQLEVHALGKLQHFKVCSSFGKLVHLKFGTIKYNFKEVATIRYTVDTQVIHSWYILKLIGTQLSKIEKK